MTRSTASLALTIRATDSTGPPPVDVAAIAETIALAIRDSYRPGGINLCGYAEVGALVVQLSQPSCSWPMGERATITRKSPSSWLVSAQ